MTITQVPTERFTLISRRSFDEVLAAIDGAIGHPDLAALMPAMAAATTYAEMETLVQAAVGPTGLMAFVRFDIGDAVGKGRPGPQPRMRRLLIGNPLTMRKMAEHVPEAGAYAPITVFVDERADGVHLGYDRMASSLAPYANAAATEVARALDANVEAVLAAAAG